MDTIPEHIPFPQTHSAQKEKVWALTRERSLNRQIYELVQISRNEGKTPSDREKGWESALATVVDKKTIKRSVFQSLRPAEYHEPLIDQAVVVDQRILESFSPPLKKLTDEKAINPAAAYAITELFLRDNRRGLTQEQTVILAGNFPPLPHGQNFADYKRHVLQTTEGLIIHGRNGFESWELKRQVLDILQISDTIRKKYLEQHTGKKTIFITDLMKVSAEALKVVHMSSSRLGTLEVEKEDVRALAGHETDQFMAERTSVAKRLLRRPDVLLSILLRNNPRDLAYDTERLLQVPPAIQTEGLSNIPKDTAVIVAFSHINRWKDPKAPPGWEMAKMIQDVQKRRNRRDLSIVAYVNYFKETAPKQVKGFTTKLVDTLTHKLKPLYGVQLVDVKDFSGIDRTMNDMLGSLSQQQPLLISPEGAPATELLKAHRGLGMLARRSGAPTVGVAFREDKLPDGSFKHTVIFTPPRIYNPASLPGKTPKLRDQAFSDMVMQDISQHVPEKQRGIYT